MKTFIVTMVMVWLLLLLELKSALAASSTGAEHPLSAAGGISSPASNTALFQNPAGLVYQQRLGITLQGGSGPLLRGGILGGGSTFGAGAGIGHRFSSSSSSSSRRSSTTSSSSGSTDAFYGMGLNIDSLKTAFGVAGSTALSGGGTSINAGMLILPRNSFRVGVTAVGLQNGLGELGAGLTTNITQKVDLTVDTTYNTQSSSFAAQPAFTLGDSKAALTLGYGFNGGSQQLSDGFAAGGHLQLGNSVNWELYFHQLAEIYTAITFGL